MQIFINEKPQQFTEPLNVKSLLEKLKIPPNSGIAVAVNNQVVRRDKWDCSHLSDNDRILVIKATQGG